MFVVVLSIVIPGAVASAKRPAVVPTKTPAVPSCAGISRTAIAQVLKTGPLTLGSHIGDGCVFHAPPSGDYEHLVGIRIYPYSDSVWHLEQAIAKNHVAPPGSSYRYESPLSYYSPKYHLLAGFLSITHVTSQGMPPCAADSLPPSKELAPGCAGQPTEGSAIATGEGYYKSSRLQLIVVATESGLPSGSDTYVTDLLLGILSGSIA